MLPSSREGESGHNGAHGRPFESALSADNDSEGQKLAWVGDCPQ